MLRTGSMFPRRIENPFIVTTHSLLVCRGCGEKGQIWRLEWPGGTEILGRAKESLVRGSIMDAYSTEVFGRVAHSHQHPIV